MAALLSLAVVLRAGAVINGPLDPDESEHLQAAWLIGQGQVPYLDFWDHHPPLFHYLIAPLTRWLSDDPGVYFAGRGLLSVTAAASLFLLYRLGRRLGPPVAMTAVVLLAFLPRFVEKTTEVRPDAPALVAWLGALLALVRWRERETPAALWVVGLALGIASALNLKALYGAVAVAGVVMVASSGPEPGALRRTLASLARVVGGASLPILALVAGLLAVGGPAALDGLVTDVVAGNLRFVHYDNEPRPVSDAGIGFAALALAGLGLTLWREGRQMVRHPVHGPLAVPLVVISIVLWLPTTPGVARHAWLPVLAGGAIYAGLALDTLAQRARAAGGWGPVALTALALLIGLGIPAGGVIRNVVRDQNSAELQIMRLELRETCPDEPVLDGTALAVFRPPVQRFRTLIMGIRLGIAHGAISEERLVDDLRHTRPRVAYADSRLRSLVGAMAEFIRGHYVARSDGLLVLGATLAAPGNPPRGRADVELLVGGPYRLMASPGLAVAIDGVAMPRGFVELHPGRHEVQWTGPPGVISLTAATCPERRALMRRAGPGQP